MEKLESTYMARTLAEAQQLQGEFRAGGTDYMERRRHQVSKGPVVDLSLIPKLDQITETATGLQIGALVTIAAVAADARIMEDYPGLAIAAGALGTPQIRNAGTMGGALLQRTRCWYYRHEGFSCHKKGGNTCPARAGNHKFGVCFDLGPCVFPHPSTLGMVLMAYRAEFQVHQQNKRRKISELFGDGTDPSRDHLLGAQEILTHIHLPKAMSGEKAAYFRSISRSRAEWPLVECVVRFRLEAGKIAQASIAIGGVANVPLMLPEVAAYLNGKKAGETTFTAAGEIAARGASPLPMTAYKVDLIRGTVYETLRRALQGISHGEG